MTRTRNLPGISFWIMTALTLLSLALRSAAMCLSYDAEIGYFDQGILPSLADVLYFIAAGAAVGLSLSVPKDTLPTALHTPARLPVAILMGVGLVAFSILGFILCFKTHENKILAVPLIMGIPSCLYFFLSAGKNGAYPDLLALTGFLPALWGGFAILETYTDLYTPMNGPVKITLQLGFLGLMFILVAELRYRLQKPAPRMALALFGLGSFLCLSGSLPLLVAACVGTVTNRLHVLYAVVLLLGGVYGGYLLYRFVFSPPPESTPETEADTPAPDTLSHD